MRHLYYCCVQLPAVTPPWLTTQDLCAPPATSAAQLRFTDPGNSFLENKKHIIKVMDIYWQKVHANTFGNLT
jgi:hypothetical protein